jgi:redox-sensing transcriptional repressor
MTALSGKLSQATAERLSLYLRCAEQDRQAGLLKTSSKRLAEALGINDTQVRKDLTALGHLGRPGIGYTIAELIVALRKTLGLDRGWNCALIGVGHLARALLRYQGLRERSFRIVALFDNDPAKVGETFDLLTIYPLAEMAHYVRTMEIELAILAVPAAAAQAVTDQLANAGIRGILNFAPTVLRLPEGVRFVNVDVALQMEQLTFRLQSSD